MPTKHKMRTDQELLSDALKYTKRSDYEKYNKLSYDATCRRGLEFQNRAFSHMEPSRTKAIPVELIRSRALECKTRWEFKKKYSSTYNSAIKLGVLDDVCSHMNPHLNEAYSYEEICKEAIKYPTRSSFAKNSPSIYGAAIKRDDYEEICAHMPKHVDQSGENNPASKWSPGMVKEEAIKHDTRTKFAKENPKAYYAALRLGVIDDACSHMRHNGNDSTPEIELFDIIKVVYPTVHKLRDKVKIEGKPHIHRFDIDIYIPELSKGIEMDGKFHHSFKGLKWGRPNWPDKDLHNYHPLKDNHFLDKGITILHIKEEDWDKNKQACIDKCLKFLSSNSTIL